MSAAPDARAGWRAVPAPAKLNLFLAITGRRPDGYHALQTVFQLLDWGDTVWLRPRDDGRVERFGAPSYAPDPARDLVVRAANLLRSEVNGDQGVDIAVEKRIPVGGGFGGGSSDAATVLVALDRLWALGLGIDRLAALGLSLGADVPVFVRGASGWAEGVGEALTPLALGERHYLVADSGVSVPTAELFQAPDLKRDAPPATIADFLSGTIHGNAFEPVLRQRAPLVSTLLDRLGAFGNARLTGTGGGCFVELPSRAEADAAQRMLSAEGWDCRACVGVDRSPLWAALDG
ncbi:MAG: 4-(cytidine 5'-diphospho)-2-C-methyl-D-erythritol kinase [Silanimonas sp.]